MTASEREYALAKKRDSTETKELHGQASKIESVAELTYQLRFCTKNIAASRGEMGSFARKAKHNLRTSQIVDSAVSRLFQAIFKH